MKKTYRKPDFIAETFSLNHAVAACNLNDPTIEAQSIQCWGGTVADSVFASGNNSCMYYGNGYVYIQGPYYYTKSQTAKEDVWDYITNNDPLEGSSTPSGNNPTVVGPGYYFAWGSGNQGGVHAARVDADSVNIPSL